MKQEALATMTILEDLLKTSGKLTLSYRKEFYEDPMETHLYSVKDDSTSEIGTGTTLFNALNKLHITKELNKDRDEY